MFANGFLGPCKLGAFLPPPVIWQGNTETEKEDSTHATQGGTRVQLAVNGFGMLFTGQVHGSRSIVAIWSEVNGGGDELI